jgi:hypothetical protein
MTGFKECGFRPGDSGLRRSRLHVLKSGWPGSMSDKNADEVVYQHTQNGSDYNFPSIYSQTLQHFNARIKSLSATLPDEIFYWVFCFLNCVLH